MNVWAHIAIVLEPYSTQSVYINGVLKGQITYAIIPKAVVRNQNFIGKGLAANGLANTNGYMDEIKIFNRSLNWMEIDWIYSDVRQ